MADNATSLTPDTQVIRAETAISTEIDGEMVALDLERGICYGLNSVGTRVWQLIETPRTARELVAILISEFDVAPNICEEQTLALLRDLVTADLAR